MPEKLKDTEILEIRSLLKILKKPSSGGIRINKTLRSLVVLVCLRHRIEISDLIGPCRKRRLVKARIDFSHIAFRQRSWNKTIIARTLNRDHSTVIHHLKKQPSEKADAIEQTYCA